jgi:hypothetical protein
MIRKGQRKDNANKSDFEQFSALAANFAKEKYILKKLCLFSKNATRPNNSDHNEI